MFKKILKFIGIVVLAFSIYHGKSLIYGIQQGVGQIKIIWNSQEIATLLAQPNFPDSTKQKFLFIQKVKEYAEEHLGLKQTENYTTYYNQHGRPILWVVTASPEFKVQAYEWDFPIAGSFPYKGYWEFEKAKAEADRMKKLGYDVEIDEVNAWSTLGFFKDPILSSMLNEGEGRLAELIIHESVHTTLYVKDSVEFNENLASFIGKAGAEQFLKIHYGSSSTTYQEYVQLNLKKEEFKTYMLRCIVDLNRKYKNRDSAKSLDFQRKQKQQWIDSIKTGIYQLNYDKQTVELEERLDTLRLNNAYFSGFLTYSNDIPQLQSQLRKEFNGNLKEMLTSFKEKYKSL